MAAVTLFNWPVRVYYEDTDAGGVVYHSNYLNFMERARTEWLRNLGFEQTYLRDELSAIFVVQSVQIDYKKPAKFNDLLTVSSSIAKIGRSSFEVAQAIQLNEDLLTQALIRLVCVNPSTFKPIAIPSVLKLKIELS